VEIFVFDAELLKNPLDACGIYISGVSISFVFVGVAVGNGPSILGVAVIN